MPGPSPLPTNLKMLKGTLRKDRLVPNEAQPDLGIPAVPPHLSDEAKVEWGRVSQQLMGLGLLSYIDRAALTAYCDAWSDYVDASKMCATKDGQDRKVVKTAAGNFMENPYYTIKKRSMEIMHKFLTEFGMTPASRTRINAPVKPERKSKLVAFTGGKSTPPATA